ncbi:MAG: hypothetical protein COT17_07385 [Elusimicrobia bacterium CG08_land_8_20_14_0_20_51_18]|nr:MAG: hypothetical protein COT17_07385 [Elusimicrobia bacterium CG08_land_8_20_14_0_20_51_18]
MKNITLIFLVMALPGLSFSQSKKGQGEESAFLSMQKVGLGQLSDLEEKKKFLDTIQLEKQKLQYRMLQNIYENAYSLYMSGDYESAKEMASRILSIDPNFEDAQMLKEASEQLKGSLNPKFSEKLMIEDKFKAALSLYQEGAVVEAHRQMTEVVKLSPNNIKAKYWLGKIKDDLKEYYLMKGEEMYRKGDIKEALNNYYNALLIRPKEDAIIERISSLEEELRNQRLNEKLKMALEIYAQGNLYKTYTALKDAIQINPGDSKANKLLKEVKKEIEDGFVSLGRKLYSQRKYTAAIGEWNKAKPYSENTQYLEKLIARAKEQMAKEAEEKRRKEEEARRKAEEAEERRQKEEAERKKQEAAAAKGQGGPIIQQGVTEQNKISSTQHYLEGLKYFQNANYQKARDEWTIAKQLDPSNSDVEAGLKRIEQILSGGQ